MSHRLKDFLAATELSEGQVRHWIKLGILEPGVRRSSTSGVPHIFTDWDVGLATILRRLQESGCTTARLRQVSDHFRREPSLMWADDVFILRDDESEVGPIERVASYMETAGDGGAVLVLRLR